MDAYMIRNRTSDLYFMKQACRLNNTYQWAAQEQATIFSNMNSLAVAMRSIRATELRVCEIKTFTLLPVKDED